MISSRDYGVGTFIKSSLAYCFESVGLFLITEAIIHGKAGPS